jgi:hypothetical protein
MGKIRCHATRLSKLIGIAMLIVISSLFTINAQTVLAEFKLPHNKVNHLQGVSTKNKLFLLYDYWESDPHVETKACYEISWDGTSQKIALDQFDDMVLCSVSEYDSGYYFYYLSEYHKTLTLQANIYNHVTDTSKLLDDEIKIDGELWGISNEDGLSLMIYNRERNQLKVLQLEKFQITHESVFDLPVDFTMDYKYMTYIHDNYLTTIEQGSSKYKLYKKNKAIMITIDQTFDESNTGNPQTIILKLNLDDGSQTTQNINANHRGSFRSFLYKDKLYRTTISKKKHELDVFDLETGNLINKKEILFDTAFKESPVYLRSGSDLHISETENFLNMMKMSNACDPSMVVLAEKNMCNTTIIWGSYLDKGGIGPKVLHARHPVPGTLTTVIGTAVWQMMEPKGISRYSYLDENCMQSGEYNTPQTKSLREIIDDYEVSMAKEKKLFTYKGYFDFLDKTIGVYLESNSYNLVLVSFEKK